jgi:hypothetical protein
LYRYSEEGKDPAELDFIPVTYILPNEVGARGERGGGRGGDTQVVHRVVVEVDIPKASNLGGD